MTANDITVTGAELEADAKVIPVSSAVTVQDAKGAVTYEKSSGSEGISVDGANIIVSKGLAPGTYTLEILVTAAGDAGFEPGGNQSVYKRRQIPGNGCDIQQF